MIVAGLLLCYGIVVALAAPSLLQSLAAVRRAPLLGILAWVAAQLSAVGCWVLGGLMLASPEFVLNEWLNQLFAACIHPLREMVTSPYQAGRLLGVLLVIVTTARLCWCVAAAFLRGGRHRGRHADGVRVISARQQHHGYVVVEHGPPVVYCLPGRQRLIVVTRAALQALTPAELDAVLAHERTHISERHHIPSGLVGGLAAAFRLPLFSVGAVAVRTLLEMRADDVAARRYGRRAVATALLSLASGQVPQPGMGASGFQVLARLDRLLTGPQHWSARLKARVQLVLCASAAALGMCCAMGLAFGGAALAHLALCPT